eukprot:CAMPEP_0115235580 /NCGR_PEP_ID=MMETSP0270-20121206/35392_1 /TAXON_ID=71861 /ORGANISM="Scrippsiella trochoidea, Strain CCMP3099" /LENGTH=358 /DNA_ID=CAMNT_0002650383 /DNA_START=13 /DNA_END=1089 /DNA_ORIENTATION=-
MAAAGMLQMSARRVATNAACVGVAAGCMGTWFEMSHGVVCIPVLSLPPLHLSQQVAIGSTVFGVAARQVLSATLYALEPNTQIDDLDALEKIVDVRMAAALAAPGTAAALLTATMAGRLAARTMRKANGLFLITCALFMQWRETKIKAARAALEAREEEEVPEVLAQGASGPSLVAVAPAEALPDAAVVERPVSASPASDMPRLIALGTVSGGILGFFGIGPAWILAPVLSSTGPAAAVRADMQTVGPNFEVATAPADIGTIPSGMADSMGTSGSDERTRTTACLAMVPPSIAAAWRHFALGHVTNMGGIALPLAVGAVAGSAMAGQALADVPCEEEYYRYGLAVLLFAHGCWSMVKG